MIMIRVSFLLSTAFAVEILEFLANMHKFLSC